MTELQLRPFCHFYHGETICPLDFDGKNEGKIWQAEKIVCEDFQNEIDPSNPAVSFAQYVVMYIEKWAPFTFADILETYFMHCPEMRSQLH
jgi:hypothetical protein